MSSRFSRYGFTNVTITLLLWVGCNSNGREKNGNNSTNNKTSYQWYLFSIMNTDRPFLVFIEKERVQSLGNGSLLASFQLIIECVWYSCARFAPVLVVHSHFHQCMVHRHRHPTRCATVLYCAVQSSFVITITRMKFKHKEREKFMLIEFSYE